MKKLLFLLCVFSVPVLGNISSEKAVLRAVNRLKGISKELVVPVGQDVLFENISVSVKACYERKNAVGINSNYWAFLQIKDLEKESTTEKSLLFSGWMPSHAREQAALEHPLYDIWVERCE